jgi:hypothetical protein
MPVTSGNRITVTYNMILRMKSQILTVLKRKYFKSNKFFEFISYIFRLMDSLEAIGKRYIGLILTHRYTMPALQARILKVCKFFKNAYLKGI